MAKLSRLVLEIDDKGIVTANGNLDLFKKKSDEAAKAATGVEKANKDNAKSFDLVNQLTSIHTIAMGAANLAVLKFASSVVTAAGNMESIKTQLQVVSGSAKQADTIFRDLQEFAAKTPFSINGITDTAIQLMQVDVQAKDLRETLTMLGDVSGGSQEKLNRIMMNYTQILSVGKASTMDIRQFAQANLPIYQELANVTGKSGEALQNMITAGQITGDVITEAFRRMNAEGGKFYNGMNLASQTYEGKLSTMKDSISNLAAKFGELWLLDFQKNALDAITAVTDAMSLALDQLTFGKKANDAVFGNPDTASLEQWEYAANLQIEKWFRQVQYWKRLGGDNYQESEAYQESLRNWQAWIDKLDEITKKEADVIRQEREASEAASNRAKAEKAAAEEALRWKEVLKKALDLDEVTTGRQAVTDYIENIETSLNGSLVFAQAFGGSVVKVYEGYSDKVRKAIHEILQSGFWQIDEDTVQSLIKFEDRLNVSGKERQGFRTPQFGSGATPEFIPNSKAPFSLAPFGSDTGFSLGISDEDRLFLDEERVSREAAQAKRIEEIYKNLGAQLKQFAADATFDALWDLGEALYEGGNAAEAFGRSLFLSILRNVPAMLFQAGFQLAISGNVYGGLGLMAISGLGAIAGGYLTKAMDSSSNEQDEKARKLEALTQQLADLITQSKANAEYFASGLRSRNADYLNSVVSVNDAIITKDGKIIQTHPEDYLIATKTPGALIGAGASPQVSFTIVNSISNEVGVEVKEKNNAAGGKELIATLRKLVKSDIAKGEYDSVLASRTSAINGTGRR